MDKRAPPTQGYMDSDPAVQNFLKVMEIRSRLRDYLWSLCGSAKEYRLLEYDVCSLSVWPELREHFLSRPVSVEAIRTYFEGYVVPKDSDG